MEDVVVVVEHEDTAQCRLSVRLRLVAQVQAQRRQHLGCKTAAAEADVTL